MPFTILTDTQKLMLVALRDSCVRFIVVGGYAVRMHGHLREVSDLDLVIQTSLENLSRLHTSLHSVGAERIDDIHQHMSQAEAKLIWRDVDFLTALNNRSFEQLIENAHFAPTPIGTVAVLDLHSLIEAKRIAFATPNRGQMRTIDAEDLRALIPSE